MPWLWEREREISKSLKKWERDERGMRGRNRVWINVVFEVCFRRESSVWLDDQPWNVLLFVHGCLLSQQLYWPIATKFFVAIIFKCTLLTIPIKRFVAISFQRYFIVTKIFVAKNYCCHNLLQPKFCCNKL